MIEAENRLIRKVKLEQQRLKEQVENRETEMEFLQHKLKVNKEFLDTIKRKN